MVLDWLASGQHQQDVFVLNSRPADLTDSLRAGAGWYGEGNHFSLGWRKFTAIAASVRAVCRARQPDVVVCWPTGFSCWVCLGARWAGVRQLLVHAGNPPNRGPGADWITRVIMGSNALLGVRVMCCSEYVRNRFCEVPFVKKDLFAVVRNCARVAEVRRRSRQRMQRPQRPTAIMVATLERHKDHRTLLEAVRRVITRIPAFHLLLAGDGSLRTDLEEHAALLGITHAVSFLGMRLDVPELLGQTDLFVFSTTHEEGLGSALIEALAAGVPILASDVPACRELLCNGQYGDLIPPADPDALANAMIDYLEKRPRVPVDAENYLEGFTPEAMMDRYLELARRPTDE